MATGGSSKPMNAGRIPRVTVCRVHQFTSKWMCREKLLIAEPHLNSYSVTRLLFFVLFHCVLSCGDAVHTATPNPAEINQHFFPIFPRRRPKLLHFIQAPRCKTERRWPKPSVFVLFSTSDDAAAKNASLLSVCMNGGNIP